MNEPSPRTPVPGEAGANTQGSPPPADSSDGRPVRDEQQAPSPANDPGKAPDLRPIPEEDIEGIDDAEPEEPVGTPASNQP